jgi:hypothetical protein
MGWRRGCPPNCNLPPSSRMPSAFKKYGDPDCLKSTTVLCRSSCISEVLGGSKLGVGRLGKLSAVMVKALRFPGDKMHPVRFGDGDGPYLQIATGDTKSWLFRYTLRGKAREMGLARSGNCPMVFRSRRGASWHAKHGRSCGPEPIRSRRGRLSGWRVCGRRPKPRKGRSRRRQRPWWTVSGPASRTPSTLPDGWRPWRHTPSP